MGKIKLFALAAVAAVMEQSDRVCFYENGIMSINLPISTQVFQLIGQGQHGEVGAREYGTFVCPLRPGTR